MYRHPTGLKVTCAQSGYVTSLPLALAPSHDQGKGFPGEKSAVGTRYNAQLSDKKSRVSP